MKKQLVNFCIHIAVYVLEKSFTYLHRYYHVFYDPDSECFELEVKNEKS